jgi:hypothetical protein
MFFSVMARFFVSTLPDRTMATLVERGAVSMASTALHDRQVSLAL